VGLLSKPDVLVFLQTCVDMSHENANLLSELHEKIKAAMAQGFDSGDGDDLFLGGITHPFSQRLYESFAWSVHAASKVVLESGAFADLVAHTDAQLQAAEAKETTRENAAAGGAGAAATVGQVLASFLTDNSLTAASNPRASSASPAASPAAAAPSPLGSVLETYSEKLGALLAATPHGSHQRERAGLEELCSNVLCVREAVALTLYERKNYDKLVAIKTQVYSTDFFSNKV
jgi:hypothetical protein